MAVRGVEEFAVAHLFDNANHDVDYEVPPVPARRRWVVPVVVACLVLVGAGSALAWHSWGSGWPSWPTLALGTTPPETEKPVALKDFQALQQQAAAAAQSSAQQIAAQQAEIKRLADQVAALAGRIDTLQNTAAPAATPAPPAPPPAAPRKRAAAPKQQPAISVGGAPLPAPAR
jgi:uncharacterized coiled-coil protein SlyX